MAASTSFDHASRAAGRGLRILLGSPLPDTLPPSQPHTPRLHPTRSLASHVGPWARPSPLCPRFSFFHLIHSVMQQTRTCLLWYCGAVDRKPWIRKGHLPLASAFSIWRWGIQIPYFVGYPDSCLLKTCKERTCSLPQGGGCSGDLPLWRAWSLVKHITKGIYARFRENVLISYLFTPLRGILNSETGKESIQSSLPTEI